MSISLLELKTFAVPRRPEQVLGALSFSTPPGIEGR